MVDRVLPRGGFARGVGVLASGAGFGQVLTLLAAPIITRLYAPEDFGALAVFTAILAILVTVASLRYELAIPLPESDIEAVNTLALALVLVALVSGLTWIGIILLADPLLNWTRSPNLRGYLWILPISLFFAGWYQVLNYWAIRKAAFGAIARTKLAQGVGSAFIQLSFGVLLAGPIGLLAGQVAGQTAGVTTLGTQLRNSAAGALKTVGRVRIMNALVRYRRFAIISTWSFLANGVSMEVPALLISSNFGSGVTGLYALGLRVLQAPLSLVGSAIGQVFFSRAIAARRIGRLKGLVLSVFSGLLGLGFPVMGTLAIAAPELFAVVFGPTWREAGAYAQWFSPFLLLVLISSPLSFLPSVLERQGGELALMLLQLTGRVGAVVLGATLGGPGLTIAMLAGASAIGRFAYILWILQLADFRLGELLRSLGSTFVRSIGPLIPVIVCKLIGVVGGNDLLVVVGAFASGALALTAFVRHWKSIVTQ